MRIISFLLCLTSCVAGCAAYVPNLEAEATFSFSEIASQIECETFLAISKIEMERHFHNRHGASADPYNAKEEHLDQVFKTWIMSIQIKPNLNYDASVGVGATMKNSATAKDYFQWTLGGGVSPGGAAYESFGSAFADNTYIFPIMKLFDRTGKETPYTNASHHYSMTNINPALERICSPAPNRKIGDVLKAMVDSEDLSLPNTVDKRFSVSDADNLHQDAVPNFLDYHGLFGIYDFLDRSLAVNGDLDILPFAIGYTKQYKVRINAGVTPGWYVATGNTSPTVGAVRTIDNAVNVVFTPPDDAKVGKLGIKQPSKAAAINRFRNYNNDLSLAVNGVGAGAIDRIQITNNNLQFQNLGNQFNQGFR